MSVLARHNVRLQPLSQDRQLAFHRASINELKQTKSFVIRDRKHRLERSLNAFGKQAALLARSRRSFTENSSESVAKTAFRFEAAAISDLIHALAHLHSTQSETHSTGA